MTAHSKDTFLIVDGNNITLRAMYGTANLYDKEGNPTGCLMTTIRSICKAANAIRPVRTFFVWDGGHSKFRRKIFPQYKVRPVEQDEERENLFEEWRHQVALLEEYLPILGVGSFRIPGCEADDIIYRLTRRLIPENFEAVIVSSDADFFQLVDPFCSIYHLSRDKVYGPNEMFEEYGVRSDQWVDYRSMIGDPSDKIDGVKGIGPKKAAEILKDFPDIESFYNFVEIMEPKWLEEKGRKHHRDLAQNRYTIERNQKLMDFKALPESEIDGEIVDSLISDALDLKQNRDAFWKVCVKHQLNTLINESYLWGTLWRPA